jgi:hypothetical protein
VTNALSAGTVEKIPLKYCNIFPAWETDALMIGKTARSPGASTEEWSQRAA